jgi:hypothetical protein
LSDVQEEVRCHSSIEFPVASLLDERWRSSSSSVSGPSSQEHGTATLSSNKKSGKFDGELLAASNGGADLTGGPGVHAKGKFKCGKVKAS